MQRVEPVQDLGADGREDGVQIPADEKDDHGHLDHRLDVGGGRLFDHHPEALQAAGAPRTSQGKKQAGARMSQGKKQNITMKMAGSRQRERARERESGRVKGGRWESGRVRE